MRLGARIELARILAEVGDFDASDRELAAARAELARVKNASPNDAARIESPDHRIGDEIVLKGTIALRSYPGGHYRYAVAIGERHFTVTDDRYLGLETPVGLRLPLDALHLFPNAHNKGGHHA